MHMYGEVFAAFLCFSVAAFDVVLVAGVCGRDLVSFVPPLCTSDRHIIDGMQGTRGFAFSA